MAATQAAEAREKAAIRRYEGALRETEREKSKAAKESNTTRESQRIIDMLRARVEELEAEVAGARGMQSEVTALQSKLQKEVERLREAKAREAVLTSQHREAVSTLNSKLSSMQEQAQKAQMEKNAAEREVPTRTLVDTDCTILHVVVSVMNHSNTAFLVLWSLRQQVEKLKTQLKSSVALKSTKPQQAKPSKTSPNTWAEERENVTTAVKKATPPPKEKEHWMVR